MSEATPRPWRAHRQYKNVWQVFAGNICVAKCTATFREVGIGNQDEITEANAALIVTAVNAHSALVEAAQANFAWHIAEQLSLGSFQARMELCGYSQWLTRKALGEVSDYQGVPRLLLDQSTMNVELERRDVDGCKALVRETLAEAALAQKGAP
jgi:hypothetical protein